MKTTFGSGVIITSKYLNGAKRLWFDGKDEDWHYDPLNLDSIQKSGDLGFDNRYVTRSTEQDITGKKNFLAPVHFGVTGDDCVDCATIAPLSFSTNQKWLGGTNIGSITRLQDADVITKRILEGRIGLLDFSDLWGYSCALPVEGNILSYREETEKWTCTDEIDGGTY